MTRPLSLALVAVVAGLVPIRARPARADDPRFAVGFIQGLRDRGYHDLTVDYVAALRADPGCPADLKGRLDFEEGRALVAAATHGADPEKVRLQLDAARKLLDAFIKANPGKPESLEALTEMAALLYERARGSAIDADEAKTPAEKDAKLVEARGYLGSARTAYAQAFDRLESKFKTFPNFIADGEPLKLEKDRTAGAMMSAELQKAVVDYEEAQTYPFGSPQRAEILDRTGRAFEDVYKRHRTQLAGITAQMWQGKCYEERGEFGKAKGIYDALLDHADPRLRPLQKKVDYFRILLMGKRKDHALAADEALAWLRAFPNDRRSYESLGVQLELAKDILAQLPESGNPEEKGRAMTRATETLREIVKVYSPFRAEALALLNTHAPKVALKADQIAAMNYDDTVAAADAAVSTGEFDKAAAIFRAAIRKGAGREPIEKINKARYTMAFSLYMSKRYYESAALAEHVARRFPGGEWSPKATEIALASFADAYNAPDASGRPGLNVSDLRRIDSLARFAVETWPDTDQGDIGRMTAGQIAKGEGRYPEAVALFDAVRAGPKKADALAASGDAHWKRANSLRDKDPNSKEADAEVAKAIDGFKAAIKARRDLGAGDADLSVAADVSDLASIDLEIGKPDEALKLISPLPRALAGAGKTPAFTNAQARALAIQLRGHVAIGQVDAAIADMNSLEQSGGAGADRAQLYFQLGALLEKELESLRKKNDVRAIERTQAAYQKFLKALVASKAGQSFTSMRWAGDNLLKLKSFKEASDVFEEILKVYGEDSTFLSQPNASTLLLVIQIHQVTALRGLGAFDEVASKLHEIKLKSPNMMEVKLEEGYVLSDRAAAKKGNWSDAEKYWTNLATRLRQVNPKPTEYFECWYQAALALRAMGKPAQARQVLGGIMRLSPTVGTPEMKTKYQSLIDQLK